MMVVREVLLPLSFTKLRSALLLMLAGILFTSLSRAVLPADSNSDGVKRGFKNPPDDCRIMMRWWWFGPAVTKPELKREIEVMKAAGIGGFEIQPVYPMTLDDPEHGKLNLPYLSPGFLDDLHFAGETAKQLGMRFDLTLGSGWPYGGPNTPVTEASAKLRVVKTSARPGSTTVPLPSLETGERLLAAFSVSLNAATKTWKDIQALPIREVSQGDLRLPKALADGQVVVFFVASRTGMMVKRAAVVAEGFVLDHLNHRAVERFLKNVGDPLMSALTDDPPYAVFSDSLEDYGADWTPNFLEEFRNRRGYDLTPYLPDLVENVGPEAYDVRYDWGRTLTELLEENYLSQVRAWAHLHRTQFRAQVYGPPDAIMSSNEFVDLPEGEGANWRGFSPIRWAASANHFYGNAVTSSESFTWIHTLPFGATPLDLKAEADVDFLEGSNQLIGHGWPYSPPYAAYPGWAYYAAGALDDDNPWWIVMPAVTRYMQRVSYVLRQGTAVNDVALLLPTEDAWSAAAPGPNVPNDIVESMSDVIGFMLGTHVTGQVIDAGLGLEYVDSHMIDMADIRYPILILPGIASIPLRTYERIEAFAKQGGVVIATRRLPSHAPGLQTTKSESQQVREISRRLFQLPASPGHFLPDELQLNSLLRKVRKPDMSLSARSDAIVFVHRHLKRDEDIYFVVNTSNKAVRRRATFRSKATHAEVWDPLSGQETGIPDGQSVELELAPYESKVFYLSSTPTDSAPQTAQPSTHFASTPPVLDLGKQWNVIFPGIHHSTVMHTLHSWTDDKASRFYSGEADYERDFDLPSIYLRQGLAAYLDFGPGTPVPESKPMSDGMRTWLESPIREAALVYVNGTLAGSVWHPPYRLDITKLLKPGMNHLKLVVANLALNALARGPDPDYRLLNSRYGQRFSPQPGMQDLKPLPAGILGDVRLLPFERSSPQ